MLVFGGGSTEPGRRLRGSRGQQQFLAARGGTAEVLTFSLDDNYAGMTGTAAAHDHVDGTLDPGNRLTASYYSRYQELVASGQAALKRLC